MQTLKPMYTQPLGIFAYDFRYQHIRIDKNGMVRLKSSVVGSIGLLVRKIRVTISLFFQTLFFTFTDPISRLDRL